MQAGGVGAGTVGSPVAPGAIPAPQYYNGAVYGGAAPPPAFAPPPGYAPPPAVVSPLPPPQGGMMLTPSEPMYVPPSVLPPGGILAPSDSYADIDVIVDEARTGRFMFGVGVNSDAGVTGQIVVDERNFNILRPPTSFDDIINGTAFRGAGQGFRFEALPGSQLQRYLMSFTEPYLFDTPISFSLSGYYFDRRYFDWTENRVGGRMGLGYRITHDLSLATSIRGESVDISDPRIAGVPQLDRVLGSSDLFTGRVSLTHDTRDIPFAPTEGHFLELAYEQGFGDFDYPRGEIDYRQYFLLRERPDGSGRHTLSYAFRTGFSGSQTPLYENYFAGGHTTLRGFDFRGASPVVGGVIVGGQFQMLGSVEYLFPLTADDMLKGVLFTDFGTVEENIELNADNYRVAPGFGLRIFVPAMGPAPIALDFAFPVAQAPTDDERMFSFFIGFGR
ncbi:MAG: BamA/TamA family outer membrane protein [Planctomycetes bacterium]|nr:BamA/TamA family outer membrane protein [Planctomycetota bacterium]